MVRASSNQISLAELFCGAGGMALGAHNAHYKGCRYKHIWATDYNKDACDTFKNNFNDTNVLTKDIRCFDFKEMPRTDGLLFGFPCNDFSNVGKKKGTRGEFGDLYKYCIKGLQELKPLFFVAENVGGMKSTNNKKDYQEILDKFTACGYRAIPHYYKFENYKVPQRRHRIIIVGFRYDTGIVFEHEQCSFPHIAVKDALKDIPNDAPNHELTKQSQQVVERLKHIKAGQNAFSADLPKHLQLNVKKTRMSMIYRRLKPDEAAYTVTGSGGGGTHTYHWKENRALTNRERARLQTFPDNFVFKGSKESVRKQIGMAVPPMGAEVIFKSIIKTLYQHEIIDK